MSILSFLSSETKADKYYHANKFCFENIELSNIDYDEDRKANTINAHELAETSPNKNAVDLTEKCKKIQDHQPLFRYFLDGSRRTYKIGDFAYNNKIYPVVAGQIGIACCERKSPYEFGKKICEMHNVISLPTVSNASGQKSELFFSNLLGKVNSSSRLKSLNIGFNKILVYLKENKEDKYENLAIAKIQDEMISLEKNVVANLTAQKALSPTSYLIKDGSLEYKMLKTSDEKELSKIKNNYRYVVGISKKFNPDLAESKGGKSNASFLADLELFHRTPAVKHSNYSDNRIKFAIWYIRIRDKKYSSSPFDGIIKVEKILVTDNEVANGLETEEVDFISANLVHERNPVCYGSDNRWANHLYPVYLTERYIKSQYLSDNYFLNLF